MNRSRRALVALPVASLLGVGLIAGVGLQADAHRDHQMPQHGAKPLHRPAEPAFHRLATYPVYLNLPADVPADSETVAEISDVTRDGRTLIYTDALGSASASSISRTRTGRRARAVST